MMKVDEKTAQEILDGIVWSSQKKEAVNKSPHWKRTVLTPQQQAEIYEALKQARDLSDYADGCADNMQAYSYKIKSIKQYEKFISILGLEVQDDTND
jgi:hypothetical protein